MTAFAEIILLKWPTDYRCPWYRYGSITISAVIRHFIFTGRPESFRCSPRTWKMATTGRFLKRCLASRVSLQYTRPNIVAPCVTKQSYTGKTLGCSDVTCVCCVCAIVSQWVLGHQGSLQFKFQLRRLHDRLAHSHVSESRLHLHSLTSRWMSRQPAWGWKEFEWSPLCCWVQVSLEEEKRLTSCCHYDYQYQYHDYDYHSHSSHTHSLNVSRSVTHNHTHSHHQIIINITTQSRSHKWDSPIDLIDHRIDDWFIFHRLELVSSVRLVNEFSNQLPCMWVSDWMSQWVSC